MELTNDQIYANMALESWWNSYDSKQTFEISGKSGSGKSSLIHYFIDRIGLKDDEVLFLAYAGKGAQQITVRNKVSAQTIHSAIYDYYEEYDKDLKGRLILKKNGKPKTKMVFRLKNHLPKKIKLIVLDEGSQVNKQIAEDLLSFGIPIVVLGDLNQLPPVMGESYFLKEPDVILNQIMRQSEDSPIVYLANEVLDGNELKYGVYGNSAVIRKSDLSLFQFREADIVLTGTNRLRQAINNLYREEIKEIHNLDYPHIGEKVICTKNNWQKCLDKKFFLVNGTTGYVDDVNRGTYNGYSMEMDFKPDYTNKVFKNIKFDYKHMYYTGDPSLENKMTFLDRFEFAYAVTVFKYQGSEANNVLFMAENFYRDKETQKKFLYTGITRARDKVIIVR